MKKIRFGIVGTGTIAHRFAQAVKNVAGAELVAVASRTKENAESFGDEFGIPVRFASYEEMTVKASCHRKTEKKPDKSRKIILLRQSYERITVYKIRKILTLKVKIWYI